MKQIDRFTITLMSVAGTACLIFALIYLITTIFGNQWDNTLFRIPKIVLTVGGLVLLGISRIVSNQVEIISKLDERKRGDNV